MIYYRNLLVRIICGCVATFVGAIIYASTNTNLFVFYVWIGPTVDWTLCLRCDSLSLEKVSVSSTTQLNFSVVCSTRGKILSNFVPTFALMLWTVV